MKIRIKMSIEDEDVFGFREDGNEFDMKMDIGMNLEKMEMNLNLTQ